MKILYYPINEFGAEALNENWFAQGDGIEKAILPEEEFATMEFDVFRWAFDKFDIDIDDYEDDVIPLEYIDDFLVRIEELKLNVPVFVKALKSAKNWGSIVHCLF